MELSTYWSGSSSFDPVVTSAPCPVGARAPPSGVLPLPPEFIAETPAFKQPPSYPAWELGLKVAAYVAAMALGIVGNAIILLIVLLSKRMHSLTNVYVANLAASDLLVSAFCMWVHLGLNISPEWPFGTFVCTVSSFVQGQPAILLVSISNTQKHLGALRFCVKLIYKLVSGMVCRSISFSNEKLI